MRNRLALIVAAALYLATPAALLAEAGTVWKDAGCQCCSKWITHMSENGFELRPANVSVRKLLQLKNEAGIPREMAACHTARIGGYIIEGHVPAADVKRLLDEKPDAVGLTVPGMPVGSPGMEQGDTKEPYDVLLVKRDGSVEVFAKH